MLDLFFALLAGLAAGAINSVVGSGTLISFPVLLAIGLPPVSANITSTFGLVPGSFAGAWGYRRELVGQRRRVSWLLPASLSGGVAGALLLLVLPESAFAAIVPGLVLLSLFLVVVQPSLQRLLRERRARRVVGGTAVGPRKDAMWAAVPVTALTGVYGGYFGAAQGVLLLGALGAVLDEELQRLNGLKNILAGSVNLVAAVVFLVVAPQEIVWPLAAAVAVGSLVGGYVGSTFGRRLPAVLLRGVIVVVGLVAVGFLVLG